MADYRDFGSLRRATDNAAEDAERYAFVQSEYVCIKLKMYTGLNRLAD